MKVNGMETHCKHCGRAIKFQWRHEPYRSCAQPTVKYDPEIIARYWRNQGSTNPFWQS